MLDVEDSWNLLNEKPGNFESATAAYRRLLDLYSGCRSCMDRLHESFKVFSNRHAKERESLDAIEEAFLRNDPLEHARFLDGRGRRDKAAEVALAGLERERLVERRIDLLWVLVRIHQTKNETTHAKELLRRIDRESPLRPDLCPIPWELADEGTRFDDRLETSDDMVRLDQIHELHRRRPSDPFVTCYYNEHLHTLWGSLKGLNGASRAEEVSRRFPDGIEPAIRELAREASSPHLRAGILLRAAGAQVYDPKNLASGLRLLDDAEAASSAPRDRAAVLELRMRTLQRSEKPVEAASVARELASKYAGYTAACEACKSASAFETPCGWVQACGSLARACYSPADEWWPVLSSFPSATIADLERLRASDPPDEIVPFLLLHMSDVIREADPERANELETQAIHHSQFPMLVLGGAADDPDPREARAERREDFETAFLLAERQPEPNYMHCVPGEKFMSFRAFRILYYKVRLGIDMPASWRTLLRMVSDGPEPEKGSYWYRTEILDRLVLAAKTAHRESDARAWLEDLRDRCRQARNAAPASAGGPRLGSPAAGLRQMELMIEGYLRELDAGPWS